MAVEFTSTQMVFPKPDPTDAQGNPVALSDLKSIAYVSSDVTIGAIEKRNETTGVADPAGVEAVVAQGPLGTFTVTCTLTNQDDTTDILTADMLITHSPNLDAVGGTLGFSAPMEKA